MTKRIIALLLLVILSLSIISCEMITGESPNGDGSSDGDNIKIPLITYYDVNFETNGGSSIRSQEIRENGNLSEPNEPYKDQYAFEGWYLDKQLTQAATFPLTIKGDTTLYAGWLRVEQVGTCKDAKIKFWGKNDFAATYSITPSGFDFDKLNKLGYKFQITVTYDVYYKKDYDVPFDIGYAGAPKYEAYVINSSGNGFGDSDLSTSKSAKTRTIEFTARISDIQNEKWTLSFSTDNIQNLIYFENIVVEYKCVK